MDLESEIDYLEATLNSIREAIENVKDTPYHGHLASGWELDAEEIQSRLDELHLKQNEQWKKDMQQQNIEYEEARL